MNNLLKHSDDKDDCISISLYFEEYWFTGVSLHKPVRFDGKNEPSLLNSEKELAGVIGYVSRLVNAALDWEREEEGFNTEVEKEAWRYGDDGLSMFANVVLYYLLNDKGTLNGNKLNYYQGYYEYVGKNPTLDAYIENQVTVYRGPHSWLMLNDVLIDLTICSQKHSFEFPESTCVVGALPNGMSLYGCLEPVEVIESYANHFAKRLGMEVEGWVSLHKNAMVVFDKVPFES